MGVEYLSSQRFKRVVKRFFLRRTLTSPSDRRQTSRRNAPTSDMTATGYSGQKKLRCGEFFSDIIGHPA